ncbi:MAG TPA: permease prefix domain 1-containing protein, partial [Bryobacteraceae bacterium]
MSVDVREDERVQTYLRHVCGQVKAAEMHRDIRLELESHIQELVDDKMDGGQPSGQAVEETLIELGNPLAIGKGLHQVHKPKMEWGLLAIVFMFLTMALFAVFAVGTSMQQSRLGFGADFFKREMVFVALGLGVMLSLYFMDYRKIERWAWAVLASPLLLVLLAHLDGSKVNGQIWLNVGSFGFDV